MAGKAKEGTAQMIAQYCSLLDQGYSTAQIAQQFGLCTQTVYNNLERISRESGRPLADLKPQRANKAPKMKPKTKSEAKSKALAQEKEARQPDDADADTETEKLRKRFSELGEELDDICAEIKAIIDAEKSMPKLEVGGEKDD